MKYDAIVIGAGFYGLRVALYLKEDIGLDNILILEAESEAMTRASYVNQARVHQGYHYPRSVLTGYRSAQSFDTFVQEYKPAIVSDFIKYYGIARSFSKVNARQFEAFCDKIGAPYEKDDDAYSRYFNPKLTESIYRVKEYAFDSRKTRQLLLDRIVKHPGVEVRYNSEVKSVFHHSNGGVGVALMDGGTVSANNVFNCTYAQLNAIHRRSDIELLPLKHEVTEMCLVQLPDTMRGFSITMMDGPFFSIMPFPSRGLCTLSHVRYTPHMSWVDNGETSADRWDTYAYKEGYDMKTNFKKMYADVVRFIPELSGMKLKDTISEVKTVLLKSEGDDSRPILFRSDFGIQGYTCIMGGKLDNIYDAFREIDLLYGKKEQNYGG